jgi:hypothetical protein
MVKLPSLCKVGRAGSLLYLIAIHIPRPYSLQARSLSAVCSVNTHKLDSSIKYRLNKTKVRLLTKVGRIAAWKAGGELFMMPGTVIAPP